jgi:salicylate hydroxylase
VRRYDGTRLLAETKDWNGLMEERYGAPFWGMHRVDLQRVMLARARELGVDVRLGCRAVSVDFAGAEVELASGERVKGDVVLCAEGLWSAIRGQFLGRESRAKETGDLAYRIVINTADLTDPELKKFVEDSTVNFWVGPYAHAVSYTLRAGSMLNVVLLCPDDLPQEVSKAEGDLEEMRKLFEGWDPLLRRLLEQVKGVAKWKLCHLETLPEWTNPEGTFLMAGDACHPMLPYLAQGANSSLEDGAVLGYLLGKVDKGKKEGQLPKIARLYQVLRKERGEMIAKETWGQREDFHLPDGEKQEKRDELMLSMLGEEPRVDFPSRWNCPRVQRWLYGYDAYKVAEEAFHNNPF